MPVDCGVRLGVFKYIQVLHEKLEGCVWAREAQRRVVSWAKQEHQGRTLRNTL